ncbi:MAG: aspartate--tRNA(Asn) ligase [Thermoplasmata archaeon]|nr:aspartate--tRNA(Asn) ligase [Thermoplasmata archaeon]
MHRKYSNELCPEMDGQEVRVAGWVEDVRKLGSIAFIILRDREGRLQVTAIKKEMGKERFTELITLPRESVVEIKGKLQKSAEARMGFEILPTEFKVLSKAEVPLPLGVVDKVNAELDTRLDNRFIDLRKDEVRAIFKVKSLVCAGIRNYLLGNGFVEVHTPKIVFAGAEGGATLFEVEYFGRKAFLAQSPQLYKQTLMATGLDRIFEIAPAFRAEPSDTVRHLSEFISLDVELAYINTSEDVMQVLENLVAATIEYVVKNGEKELKLLNCEVRVPKVPFRKIPHRECLEILKSMGWHGGVDIDTEGEKLLGEYIMQNYGEEFLFITEFPTELKRGTFYAMRKDENPELTGYFDLDYRGQELTSGGQREHRYEKLKTQMLENNLKLEAFEPYLKAFRYGMPPHGGFGLGVDRFVQKMLNLTNIREAVLFPRDRLRVTP